MSCDDFKRTLHGYFLGQLTPEEVERMDAHQAGCPDCGRLMRLAQEMTCQEFTELLNDYVEERLPPTRRSAFDRHLSICPDCTAYLQSYRATIHMSAMAMKPAMRRLADEMPEDLVEAILCALAEEQSDERRDED